MLDKFNFTTKRLPRLEKQTKLQWIRLKTRRFIHERQNRTE